MYVWEEASECYATSHEEEELDIGEVEFDLPPVMAHWHESCSKASSAVIMREFDNLSKEEIQKHHKEVA
eukprot:1330511-Prorocentrum_lima.AAC.1